jgi:hypothetical protein
VNPSSLYRLKRLLSAALATHILLFGFLFASPTISRADAQADTQSATISGVATDAGGTPLDGIPLTFVGPQHYAVITGNDGRFTLAGVQPGLYSIQASRRAGAALQTVEQNYLVLAGDSPTLTLRFTKTAAGTSALLEIGHTKAQTTTTAAIFNTSAADVARITQQTFVDQGSVGVRNVLVELPGITVQPAGGSGSFASQSVWGTPAVRGSLDQETQVLLDGLPITTGTGGANPTNFFSAYTLSGVQVLEGPGATLSQIESAVNGSVDFQTLEPTASTSGSITLGNDSYGGQFSNFRFSGKTLRGDKLGYVLDYAVDGTPGSLDTSGDINLPANALINGKAVGTTTKAATTPGVYNEPTNATSSLVACCYSATQQFLGKTELAKLEYRASDAVSAKVEFLGNYTTYDNNGRNITEYTSLLSTPSTTEPTPVTIFGGVTGPGVTATNNQPILMTELRTAFHNDEIVSRYYDAGFSRITWPGAGGPGPGASSATLPLQLYGTVGSQNYNGQVVNVTFPATNPVCAGTTSGSWVAPAKSGLCPNGRAPTAYLSAPAPYAYGGSGQQLHGHGFQLAYDHPLGENGDLLTLGIEQNINNADSPNYPGNPNAALVYTTQNFQTILARGTFVFGKLNAIVSNYYENFQSTFSPNASIGIATATGSVLQVANPDPTYITDPVKHDDERLALTYRANNNTSLRFSAGSSLAEPSLSTLGATTTTPTLQAGTSNAYSNTVSNPGILPETAFGYDLGADRRFHNGLVAEGDIFLTNLKNQVVTAYQNSCYSAATNTATAYSSSCAAAGTLTSSESTNLGDARYEGVELTIRKDPPVGFGVIAQGTLLHSYPYDISPCFYTTKPNCSGGAATNLGIVNGVTYLGGAGAGSPTYNGFTDAIPYATGYGELHYRTPHGGFASLGATYYGNNNTFYVPAFLSVNANTIFPLGDADTYLSINVVNVTNAYANSYVTADGGAPVVLANGKLGLTNANSQGPRTFNISLTHKLAFGDHL